MCMQAYVKTYMYICVYTKIGVHPRIRQMKNDIVYK